MAYQDMFLLRNHESFMNAETPIDKLIFFRNVALDANGQAVVDFSDSIRDGATVNYIAFTNAVINGTATTFGTASIVLPKGGLPIALATVSTTVIAPAASKTVLFMFIVGSSDLRTVNG